MGTTRFNSIGIMGRKGDDNNSLDTLKAGVTRRIPIVASAAQQPIGINLGPGQVASAYVYVKSPEVTGATKTVEVGIVGGSGDEILAAVDVSTAGAKGSFTALTTNIADEIGYTLGSDDFVELEAYLVLEVIQSLNF